MLVTAKLDMIDQAALAAINEEEFLGKIRSLMNRIRGFNDRRNDIAHGMVVGQASGVYLTPSHTTSKKLAVPSVQERSKHPQGRYVATSDHDAYCWTADQVDSYWLTFQSLQIEVERIREECPKYLWAE
jgi:hypothetical protein